MEPIVRSLSEPNVAVVGFPVVMSQIHLFAGNLETARRWEKRGTTLQAPDVDAWTASRCLPVLAESLRMLGRPDEAREQTARGSKRGGASAHA